MMKLVIVLFFMGASLAKGESSLSSAVKRYLTSWAEQTVEEMVAEVKEVASQLEQLGSMADDPNVQRLAKLYQDNHHFMHQCDFAVKLSSGLQHFSSCVNITGDLMNATMLAVNGYYLVEGLGESIITVLNEMNVCPELSIFKQISCYKNAFVDMQNTIKIYAGDCNSFISNATMVIEHTEVDVKDCFSFSKKVSTEWVESEIKSCELDLKEKQLF